MIGLKCGIDYNWGSVVRLTVRATEPLTADDWNQVWNRLAGGSAYG